MLLVGQRGRWKLQVPAVSQGEGQSAGVGGTEAADRGWQVTTSQHWTHSSQTPAQHHENDVGGLVMHGWLFLSVTPAGKDVPLVELMYLVFTCMPGKSYNRQLRALLCLCDVFQALINSLVCWFFRLRVILLGEGSANHYLLVFFHCYSLFFIL